MEENGEEHGEEEEEADEGVEEKDPLERLKRSLPEQKSRVVSRLKTRH